MRQQLENDALAYYFRRARAWRRPVATGWRWAWGVARYPCCQGSACGACGACGACATRSACPVCFC